MGRIAIIAGASGLIGKQLLFKLIENRKYDRVIALGRSALHIEHEKLRQYETDFLHFPDLKFQSESTVDAYCCLGTTIKKAGSQEAFEKVDFQFVVSFARWTHSMGANNFSVVSAIGAKTSASVFYSRIKGKMEEAVSAIQFDILSIYRPSFLIGSRAEFRLGERIGITVAILIAPLLIGSLSKYKPIHSAQVADAMLYYALHEKPGKHVKEYNQMIQYKA